jgi:hypothetical protein
MTTTEDYRHRTRMSSWLIAEADMYPSTLSVFVFVYSQHIRVIPRAVTSASAFCATE